jgi:hypothetical protein
VHVYYLSGGLNTDLETGSYNTVNIDIKSRVQSSQKHRVLDHFTKLIPPRKIEASIIKLEFLIKRYNNYIL